MRTSIAWVIGKEVYECAVAPGMCPFCHALDVVVALPPPIRAQQPDGTTHVCHPALGGCNHGFEKREDAATHAG